MRSMPWGGRWRATLEALSEPVRPADEEVEVFAPALAARERLAEWWPVLA